MDNIKRGKLEKACKNSQGSNQNGCRPHGAGVQHVSRGDCQHPDTLSHVGPRLAAPLRRRRPRTFPDVDGQKNSAKHHERHPPRHRSKLVREFLRKSKNVNHAFHQRLSVPERRGRCGVRLCSLLNVTFFGHVPDCLDVLSNGAVQPMID